MESENLPVDLQWYFSCVEGLPTGFWWSIRMFPNAFSTLSCATTETRLVEIRGGISHPLSFPVVWTSYHLWTSPFCWCFRISLLSFAVYMNNPPIMIHRSTWMTHHGGHTSSTPVQTITYPKKGAGARRAKKTTRRWSSTSPTGGALFVIFMKICQSKAPGEFSMAEFRPLKLVE